MQNLSSFLTFPNSFPCCCSFGSQQSDPSRRCWDLRRYYRLVSLLNRVTPLAASPAKSARGGMAAGLLESDDGLCFVDSAGFGEPVLTIPTFLRALEPAYGSIETGQF